MECKGKMPTMVKVSVVTTSRLNSVQPVSVDLYAWSVFS